MGIRCGWKRHPCPHAASVGSPEDCAWHSDWVWLPLVGKGGQLRIHHAACAAARVLPHSQQNSLDYVGFGNWAFSEDDCYAVEWMRGACIHWFIACPSSWSQECVSLTYVIFSQSLSLCVSLTLPFSLLPFLSLTFLSLMRNASPVIRLVPLDNLK